MIKKFFTELSRVLAMHDIETAPPERNALPVLLNGQSACHVEPSGDMCIFPDDLRSPEAAELYHKVAPFSKEVREYLTAIERAPLLKATACRPSPRRNIPSMYSGMKSAGSLWHRECLKKQTALRIPCLPCS